MRAILLAGGRASRLGGIDKTALAYDGRTLLEHALAATEGWERVVVADRAPAGVPVVREEPRWAGPVAALAAGLAALAPLPQGRIAVLAADQPHIGDALPWVLAAATGDADGWIAVDDEGRRQPLLAVYREERLREALALLGDPADVSLRALLAPLTLAEVPLPGVLSADVDTPDDARALGIPIPAGRSTP